VAPSVVVENDDRGLGMARVFITGSTDGLGLMAGEILIGRGHDVTLHARDDQWAADVRTEAPKVERVVTGDLSSIAAMRSVAAEADEA
jgi:NAD(P)-dependent dehydrogenase (short-subunit alcohol dehydrogenase family)